MIAKMTNSKTEVILALDVESRAKAEHILEKTGDDLKWVKMNKDNLNAIGVNTDIPEQVDNLARLSVESGINGIVSSPLELVRLRPKLPTETIFVTPGIRPIGSSSGDQKRIMTPKQAANAGADFLVIGRPILEAVEPKKTLFEIQTELSL